MRLDESWEHSEWSFPGIGICVICASKDYGGNLEHWGNELRICQKLQIKKGDKSFLELARKPIRIKDCYLLE